MTSDLPPTLGAAPSRRHALAASRVRVYPWHSLRRCTRADFEATEQARRYVAAHVHDAHAVTDALARRLGCAVTWQADQATATTYQAKSSAGIELRLRAGESGPVVVVRLEDALALRVVAAVLGHKPPPHNPAQPMPPELVGAVSAVVLMMGRRTGDAWQLVTEPLATGTALASVSGVLRLGPESFRMTLAAVLPAESLSPAPFDLPALERLGNLPISLALVGSVARATREEMAALEVGSAWLPDDALQWDPSGRGWHGPARLLAPAAEVALTVTVEVSSGGGLPRIVLTGETEASPWDAAGDDDDETMTSCVVRTEVGQVTLPARQWARLAEGDEVPMTWNPGRRTYLRGSGTVFASGELVAVEGRAAVRVTARGPQ